MGKKTMPFSEFKKKFDKKSQGLYTYLEGYTRMSRKIKVQCNICGHIFEPVASYFVNTETGCKNCDLIKRSNNIKTLDEQAKVIKQLTNDEYELLEYNGSKNKATFLHKICGEKYITNYSAFVNRDYRCECSRRRSRKYTIEELNQIYKDKNYEIIDIKYPDAKIAVHCNNCNKIIETNKNSLDKNYKLSCCKQREAIEKNIAKENQRKEYHKNIEKKKEQKRRLEGYRKQLRNETKFYKYYKEFKLIHGDDIDIKEIVYKTEEKFLVKCNICNHEWKANFKKLREGKGCPICKASKGEKVINKYLIDNNYSFEREYSFKDSEIQSLRFDFAVNIKNKLYLIEFDGKQHFNIESQFGDKNKEDKYNKLIANDNRKNKYCKDNNIPLLRIPYWDINNIEKILSEFLTIEE